MGTNPTLFVVAYSTKTLCAYSRNLFDHIIYEYLRLYYVGVTFTGLKNTPRTLRIAELLKGKDSLGIFDVTFLCGKKRWKMLNLKY